MTMGGFKNWDDSEEVEGVGRVSEAGEVLEEAAETPVPQLVYGNVSEFFREFLRHAYKRVLTGRQEPFWDPEWWRHDEAVMRLESLWRSWEHLRTDGATGTSVWWRDHADHHMPKLMAGEGPFGASDVKTSRGEPLPHTEPPEGLFVDERLREATSA